MKKQIQARLNAINAGACKVAAVAGAALSSAAAFAEVDITKVEAGITSAQGQGESVGSLVIGAVAALVVVGIIIGLVKKL